MNTLIIPQKTLMNACSQRINGWLRGDNSFTLCDLLNKNYIYEKSRTGIIRFNAVLA